MLTTEVNESVIQRYMIMKHLKINLMSPKKNNMSQCIIRSPIMNQYITKNPITSIMYIMLNQLIH